MSACSARGMPRSHRVLRACAIALLIVYLAWNAWWLAHGTPAPSILIGLVDLPAPTTGMTRALRALAGGRVGVSLWWNPFAVPFLLLFVYALGRLACRAVRRQRLVLPEWVLRAVLGLYVAAWIAKFALGPATW